MPSRHPGLRLGEGAACSVKWMKPGFRAGHLAPYLRAKQGRSVMIETEPEGLPSLRDAARGLTVARVGSPLWSNDSRQRDWEVIAASCNEIMDPSLWGPPPWTANRWCGLAGALAWATDYAENAWKVAVTGNLLPLEQTFTKPSHEAKSE